MGNKSERAESNAYDNRDNHINLVRTHASETQRIGELNEDRRGGKVNNENEEGEDETGTKYGKFLRKVEPTWKGPLKTLKELTRTMFSTHATKKKICMHG